MSELTDEKLDEWEYNARRVWGEHGERVDTICDGIDVMARTIREQRAEIERLRNANADAFDSGFRRGTCENNPIWPEKTDDQ